MAGSLRKDKCDPSCFDRQMERTVREFRLLFENVLKSLCIPPYFKYFKFRRSLGDIRSLRNLDVSLHKEVDYKQNSFRQAYIFAYSIIHSVTVYNEFSDMMICNPTMLKRISSMKDIGLCVFGGGPAFEVVAISKLLSNVLAQLGAEGREPLHLQVTVIDICTEWEREIRCIISYLQKELQTFDNVTINFSFIQADLAEDFLPMVEKAFKKAHFITMNKVLSDIYKAYGREKMFDMINHLIESMSYKSCLFLLDFSGGGIFNKSEKIIDKFPCIKRIYGPTPYRCCVLKEDTVERFSTNLQNILPRLKCTVQSTISCSAWIKIRNVGNTVDPFMPFYRSSEMQRARAKDESKKRNAVT